MVNNSININNLALTHKTYKKTYDAGYPGSGTGTQMWQG